MARDDYREQRLPTRQAGQSGLSRGPYYSRGAEGDWWSTSPFQMMRRMHDEMDRLFGSFFSQPWGSTPGTGWGGQGGGAQGLTNWAPSIDVYEAGNEYVVKVDVPGVEPEDLEITCTDDALVIRGEMRREDERREEGGFRSERRYGRFERHIPLPAGTRTEEIRANCRHGVLEIRIPKPAEAQQRQRRIPIGSQAGERGSLVGTKGGQTGSAPGATGTATGSTQSQGGTPNAESAGSATPQRSSKRQPKQTP